MKQPSGKNALLTALQDKDFGSVVRLLKDTSSISP
jgi:hypothetical protein